MSAPARFAVRFIETYRADVGPRLGVTCPHTPSCSAYGLAAYREHGFAVATWRTARRVLTCGRRARRIR